MKNKIKISIFLFVLISGLSFNSFALERVPYSSNPYYYYIMARVSIERGDLAEGIKNYRMALRLNKDDVVIRQELLDLYYITGNYERALPLAAHLYTQNPEDKDLATIYADILAKNDKIDRAIETYNRLLKLYPEDNDIRINLAALYQLQSRDKKALKNYLEVLKHEPENNFARISIGDIYLSMKKYSAAEDVYLESVKYGADIRDIYRQVALLNKYRGKRKKAEKYLQKILKRYPEDLKTLLLLSEIYQDSNQLKKSEKILKKVKKITDSNMGVLLRLGMLYEDMERTDDAIEIFKEATDRYADDYKSWYFLGLTYEYAGKFKDAEKVLLKAASIYPGDEQIYFHLGIIYDQLGQSDKAVDMFKKCLEINPDHASAHNYLGYTWADRGTNLDDAEFHIKRALEISPDNQAYIDSFGWLLYKQKKYERAIINLKKASSMSDDPVIYEHLGDAYLKINKKAKALKNYKKALKLNPGDKRIKEKIKSVTQE